MKRRVRTQPTNPFYSNEPAVARSNMADNASVQNASLGNQPPKTVDKKPGRMSGVAGFVAKGHPPTKKAHLPSNTKLPAPAKVPKQGGSLRMSGHPSAHRIGGGIKPLKKI